MYLRKILQFAHTPIFSFESSKLILNRPLNLDIESRIDIAISKFAQNWEQILSFQENYKTFNSTFLFNVENLIFWGTSEFSFNYAVYLYVYIIVCSVENIKLFLQLLDLRLDDGRHFARSRDEEPVHVEHGHLVALARAELNRGKGVKSVKGVNKVCNSPP